MRKDIEQKVKEGDILIIKLNYKEHELAFRKLDEEYWATIKDENFRMPN